MKDLQTVFDDLAWSYTEQAHGHASDAVKELGAIDEMLDDVTISAKRLTAELLLPIASAQVSIAHSLAHIAGLLEVIAGNVAVRP